MSNDLFDYAEPVGVPSPCVNICVIDQITTWCLGCGRSGDEVEEWFDTSDQRRQSILDALPERMELLRAR